MHMSIVTENYLPDEDFQYVLKTTGRSLEWWSSAMNDVCSCSAVIGDDNVGIIINNHGF
jgi:hypothetical protein